LDYQDTPTAQYLQAYTHTEGAICLEILNLLTDLGAIDTELWQQRKIIWSQGFVDNLAELYARRKVNLPTKASILSVTHNPNREMDATIKLQEDCRKKTQEAIEAGVLVKGPCEICETRDRIEAHHPDYSKPLVISWLCKSHHAAWHSCEQNALSAGLVLAENSLRRFIDTRKLQRERVKRESKEREVKGAPPPPNGSGGALVPVPVLFYSCPHFDIDADYFQQLLADYPGLDKNQMLMEIKKAADYCTDNPKNHKRNSKGKLVNQKLYLRNWMGRATTQGQRGQPMSKAEQVTAANLRAAQEVMKDYE